MSDRPRRRLTDEPLRVVDRTVRVIDRLDAWSRTRYGATLILVAAVTAVVRLVIEQTWGWPW